jgi:hypothetical protein
MSSANANATIRACRSCRRPIPPPRPPTILCRPSTPHRSGKVRSDHLRIRNSVHLSQKLRRRRQKRDTMDTKQLAHRGPLVSGTTGPCFWPKGSNTVVGSSLAAHCALSLWREMLTVPFTTSVHKSNPINLQTSMIYPNDPTQVYTKLLVKYRFDFRQN